MKTVNTKKDTNLNSQRNWLRKVACIVVLLACPWGAPAQSLTTSETDYSPPRRMAISRAAAKPLQDILRGLPEADTTQLIEKFQCFKPHAHDASLVNLQPASDSTAAPPQKRYLGASAPTTIAYGLSPSTKLMGNEQTAKAFLSQIKLTQWWSALEELEADRYYVAACRLALAMSDSVTDPAQRDLLALIAARTRWMDFGDQDPQYLTLIAQAAASRQDAVAGAALLWEEAVSLPQSAEGLLLCHQLWAAVWLDRGDHMRGFEMALRMAKGSRVAFEKERSSNRDAVAKARLLGRINAIGSRAAFQVKDRALLDWTLANGNTLTGLDPDDKLFPLYNKALDLNSHNDYAGAIKAYEQVFFSGTACDTSALAGCRMAECFINMGDKIGAMATLEMMNKLCSGQKFIMPQAYRRLQSLRRSVENLDPTQVSQFIDKHYRKQLDRVLAERAKAVPSRVVAQLETR